MKHKLLKVYCILLLITISTMILLWGYIHSNASSTTTRDLPEIKQENILRIVSLQSYPTINDTINAFHYTMCRSISHLSGMEVQIQFLNSFTDGLQSLQARRSDIIFSSDSILQNRPNISFLKVSSPTKGLTIPLFILRKESSILQDSLHCWIKQMIENGTYQEIQNKYYPQ